jgi:hypothetical protein
MRIVREKPTPAIVNIARSAHAAGVSVTNTFDHRLAIDVLATLRRWLKTPRADSESRSLAIKKFSWLRAPRLIAARQNRIFERIATG